MNVKGRIFWENGLHARKITLRAYHRGFGETQTPLGDTETDEQGQYTLAYNPPGKLVNLEVRAIDLKGHETSLSATKFNADEEEELNLVVPNRIQQLELTEFERLKEDLSQELGEISKIAAAQEKGDRQDLTVLHEATGWDARLIALAAIAFKTATEIKEETKIEMPPDALYALFRAGLPTDKEQLALVSSKAVELALKKVKSEGIINDEQRTRAQNAFAKFASAARKNVKAPGALSSVGELLERAELTEEQQNLFQELYFTHQDNGEELWEAARGTILEPEIDRLRLQGKLAYLTYNNAKLTAFLQDELGSLDNLAELVELELYQSETWKDYLCNLAVNDEDALQNLIPPAYEGETVDERLNAYASDNARKVRLSFPTQIVGRMIEKDELRLGELKKPVRTFLKNATALDFELGQVPLNRFIQEHQDEEDEVFQDIDWSKINVPEDTSEEKAFEARLKVLTEKIKQLSRLYQITPTNEALTTLSNLGFTSAYDVTLFSPDALWSNLPTTGKHSLYAQLFLKPTVLKDDPVFDHPLGHYLCYLNTSSGAYEPFTWDPEKVEDVKTGNVGLKNHLLTLQGALNLTADEIGQILTDSKGKPLSDAQAVLEKAPLTLANVSLLYRYGLLAKALKLSIKELIVLKELSGKELIVLKELSGLNPFKSLHSKPLTTLDEDYPFTQTLKFVEIAEKVQESGFKVEDLNYLLRHQFDPVGKYRPNPNSLLALVKSLATEIRRIRSEYAIPEDPASLTDDLLQQTLSLVLPTEVVATFMGMWTGTVVYEEIKKEVKPDNKLKPEDFAKETAIQVSYDKQRQRQRLTYKGVLLQSEIENLDITPPSTVSALVKELLKSIHQQAKDFFEKHFQVAKISTKHFTGFLEESDFNLLFARVPEQLKDEEKQKNIRDKRSKLAQAFFPFLQQQLLRQYIVETLATTLDADLILVKSLLTNDQLLTDPSQPKKPLIEAFAQVGQQGISAKYFDGSGNVLKTQTVATADTTGKPEKTKSIRLEGYLEVPTAGAYRFFAASEKKQDVKAEFRFAHLSDPLFRGKVNSDDAENFIELKANVPYHFTFDVNKLGDSDISLLVQGQNLPKGSLARLTLYPETVVEGVHRAHTLLSKTLQLVQGWELSDREVTYLLTHKSDFNDLDLSKLPTREADSSATQATKLFKQFIRLADYVHLKRDLDIDDDALIDIFENARRSEPASTDVDQAKDTLLNDLCTRVANLTRREPSTVSSTAKCLGFSAQAKSKDNQLQVVASHFASEKDLWRLWKALQVVEKLGVPVEKIVSWTEIVSRSISNQDAADIASDLRNTVKACYETENWQRIAQSIFDPLRQLKRDALVAYILHQKDFERQEKLFEYFLIDPGMEPVVQTSRIRLAISSVQLFIQRCLLNLELWVQPSAINSKHWQWMKRYRVWEANRKIFLYPENWLEPEFRDDKTHLFQELESALLQGDVSNDLVEDAFFNYLKKLEELARLDIVTMYCEEKFPPTSNVLHVIGRTYSIPHKYFYRSFAHQMWTPWEPVTADIEGDHIVAVVWRERLHLFWVTFLEKAEEKKKDSNPTGKEKSLNEESFGELMDKVAKSTQRKVDVQLNWVEYFQGKWMTRESSGFDNPISVNVDKDFDSSEVSIYVSKDYDYGEEQDVIIKLISEKHRFSYLEDMLIDFDNDDVVAEARAFRITTKNSQPTTDWVAYPQKQPYLTLSVKATQHKGSGELQVTFKEQIITERNKKNKAKKEPKTILQKGNDYSLLTCANQLESVPKEIGVLVSPFFYQDNQHTFFIEPNLTETTIKKRQQWGVTPLFPSLKVKDKIWWDRVLIEPSVPDIGIKSHFHEPINPLARFKIKPPKDWLTNPRAVLQFDERFVGQGGGFNMAELRAETNVTSGSNLMPNRLLAASSSRELISLSEQRLNVVGSNGLNLMMLENLNTQFD